MIDNLRKIVREADRDRYLATLFAPEEKYEHLFALYAFAAEIARIPKLVTEPQLGDIRMQWWSDTLAAINESNSVDHPIAQALAKTIAVHKLPIESLQNLIEARRFDLYADQFPTRAELEGYLGETESVLMQLAAMILDPAKAMIASVAIGNAGVALGLANILSQPNFDAKFVPAGETVDSLRALALKRLAEARKEHVPDILWPAILPAALTELYLSGKTSALRRQWQLWRAAKKKKL